MHSLSDETILTQFLSSIPELDAESIPELVKHIPLSSYSRGTVLQAEGEIPKACYFVLQGIVREYRIVDGSEKTTAFYTENNGAISSSHYIEQTPFDGYLVCTEDCILISGNAEQDAANFERFPMLKSITSRMVEADLNSTRDNFSRFVSSSPKERYLHLLNTQPELFKRVPQHQIASYLGMTPESLSRIRKRVMEDDKNGR